MTRCRHALVWLVAVTVASAVFTVTSADALAAHWSAITPPVPTIPNGRLVAVSCPSAHNCIAVGSYNTGRLEQPGAEPLGSTRPLAERWDGRRWALQNVPNPPRSAFTLDQSYLNAVDCTSTSSCVAVGAGGRFAPLAERWDGHRWSIQPTPEPVD